ncbi:MAG: SMC-Scp complex subunit ScpB [Sumerlaeia bacterium]
MSDAPSPAPAEKNPASPPLMEESEIPAPTGEVLLAAVEALLFAATEPMTPKRLSQLLGGAPEPDIKAAFSLLEERYGQPGRGLMLMEVAGGWQMATKPEMADYVLSLHKHRKRMSLSPAVMETLAIVAYKQPLTKAEVESVRGVDCGGVLRSLLDAGLIESVGHRETVGRPTLYGTTESFLKTFGLRNLDELPSVSELRNLLTAGPEEGTS